MMPSLQETLKCRRWTIARKRDLKGKRQGRFCEQTEPTAENSFAESGCPGPKREALDLERPVGFAFHLRMDLGQLDPTVANLR